MPDFEPQEWPYCYMLNASLGAPVGQPVTLGNPVFWCWNFPASRRNETISPYAVNVVASTANIQVATTVAFL